jgi:hypothetical protein
MNPSPASNETNSDCESIGSLGVSQLRVPGRPTKKLPSFDFKLAGAPALRASVDTNTFVDIEAQFEEEGVDYSPKAMSRREYRRGVIDRQLSKAIAVVAELQEEKEELDSLKERDVFLSEIRRNKRVNDAICGHVERRQRRRLE